MRISFRTRQFAYGAGAVLVVLAAVTSLGWSRVMAFEVERLDDRLCMEARRVAGPMRPDEDAARLLADLALKLRLESVEQLMMRSRGRDGTLRLQSPQWDPALGNPALDWVVQSSSARAAPRAGPDPRGDCALATAKSKGLAWRVAQVDGREGSGTLAADLTAIRSEMQAALAQALLLVVPLALTLTGISAWLLASLSLRPVNRLREAMRKVTPQALHQRLPNRGEDREFRELIAAYNTMLSRLELSFNQASRFSADAAHELKTPLTILRGRLEQAIAQSGQGAIQAELAVMLDEVGRLTGITRKLLLLSQADAGQLALRKERVDLSAMLSDLVSDVQMLLQDQSLRSDIELGLVVEGDELLLRQMFNNLVSNSARHGAPGGWITLRARAADGGIQVIVANACARLGAEQRARFFERFYRADPSRGREVNGTGLGLSLAREIARAHGGELVLDATPEDVVSLCVRLPRG